GHRFVRLSGGLSIEPNHGVIWKQGKMETNWGSLYINEGGRCLMDDVELAGPGIDVNQDYVGVTAMGAASLAFRRCEFKDYNTPVSSTLSNVHIFGACKFNDIQTGIIADGGGGGFWITDCTFEKYSWSGATISNRPTLTIGGSTWESESDSEYGLELHSVDQAVVKGSNFNGNGSNIPGPFSPSNGALDYHCGVFLDDVPLFVMRNSGMTFNPIGIVATNLMAGPSNVFLLNGSFIQRSQVGVYMDGTVTEGLVLMDCAALLHNDFGVFGTDVTLMIDAINAQQHPLDGGEPNTFLRDCTGGCGDLYFSLCYVAKIPALPIPMRENWWCVSDINTPQPAPATFMDIRSVACTVPVAVTTLPTAVRAPIACNTEEFTSATNLSGKGPEADCNVALSGGGTNGVGDAWHTAYQQLRLEDFEAAESGFQPVADLWSPDLSSYPSNCQLYIQVAKAIVDGTNGGDQLRPGGDRTTDLGKIVYANPNPTTGQLTVAFPDGPCMLRVFDPYGRLVHQAQAFGGTARLDASAWSVGIYTIEVFGADFREFVKVVVQR
ncbi:MAG: right-handed parallel beta-helix repeat-containing protein, partial [Saprospiraceae bacterium]